MTYRLIEKIFPISMPEGITDLYVATGNKDVDIDESDLVIFRLMGAEFEYSTVEFSPLSEAVGSDAS